MILDVVAFIDCARDVFYTRVTDTRRLGDGFTKTLVDWLLALSSVYSKCSDSSLGVHLLSFPRLSRRRVID
jgi:hypothetical protein